VAFIILAIATALHICKRIQFSKQISNDAILLRQYADFTRKGNATKKLTRLAGNKMMIF
jgi:hypothetical protein